MANPPSAQDVADALAMTLEREDSAGAPWCPPSDGAALHRWVIDRSASLGTGIRRAVRLARIMAVTDGDDYARFLYIRLPALRARHFRYALETAAAGGRVQRSLAALSGRGVELRERALAPQGVTEGLFEIDFAQMPRLGALLDFLHNALGFTVVADLLAPLVQRGPPATHADEVARALQAALNAWLSNRLESTNHILQAQRIRAFLASRALEPADGIDDERILLFWMLNAEAPSNEQIDGFRLYRSVAAAMLRYRCALRDATTAKHLEDALARGFDPASDENEIDRGDMRIEPWRSPLRALTLPPASRVKWLTAKEQHSLCNYLGETTDGADQDETSDENDPAWKGGLAGEERFDLAFWLTLLRADVFGAAQASIVARLRKRTPPSEAITQTMAQVENTAYTDSISSYAEIRQQLQLETLASLSALMEAGAAEAAILLNELGGAQALSAVIGLPAKKLTFTDGEDAGADEALATELRELILPALKAAIEDPSVVPDGPGRTLLLEALAATRKVSRLGFRREDRTDPDMIAALRCGAVAVFEVTRELDRLTAVLSEKAPAGDIAADVTRFDATFRRMYVSSA